ncbi:MAG: saccharopine dehydrogenase family protein [Thermodesulfobacteriota bacterium]
MRILVLGGAGLQGRAVLHDLSRSSQVEEAVCADRDLAPLSTFKKFLDMDKIRLQTLDVRNGEALVSLMRDRFDVVIDVLPVAFIGNVAEAALKAKVHVVNTMYGYQMPKGIHERALEKGIILMPESGLDPGIDLVLCGYGVSQMDEVHELHSYCGGIPELKAADNPLKYKISWTWHGVLQFYKTPARIMKDGRIIDIPAKDLHEERWVETIDFPGVGPLETIPNGDALVFPNSLGLLKTLRSTTRCSLRWPGHSAFWKRLIDLDFLSDEPVKGLPVEITPHQFMVRHLEPRLQYREGERDMVIMRTMIAGRKGGKGMKITYDLIDFRDPETGLFAMNRTVGYTASIVAQMIANREIKGRGLLTPTRDIPYKSFLAEISKRGIQIKEKIETEGIWMGL